MLKMQVAFHQCIQIILLNISKENRSGIYMIFTVRIATKMAAKNVNYIKVTK